MHVLPHHLVGVFDGLPLPVLVADVLPAGYLGEHEKPELITARNKMLRLRIVRGTHGIYAKLVFQYLCVELLHRFRHCIADVGVCLMTVEPAYLQLFSVEIEAVAFKSHRSEAEAHALFVDALAVSHCADTRSVQRRGVHRPQSRLRHSQIKCLAGCRGNDAAIFIDDVGHNIATFTVDPHANITQPCVFDEYLFDILVVFYLERHLTV